MRRFRKFFLTLGIAPVLMGAALTAGATLATPGGAEASSGCNDLAYAFYYHHFNGNSDYAAQLLQWYNDAGC